MVYSLKAYSLEPDQIDHVVCTHGHLDHVGNLNLFPKATVYLDNDIMNSDGLFQADIRWNEEQLELVPGVKLWKTPGHTCHDLSLLVENDARTKTIVIA
uniref:Metallo-beta-lactamase domain-containing protein 1 n=1 Tax=Romanomermis culicivorax TaxID=13658 RepID=A0A915JR29_ROMCU